MAGRRESASLLRGELEAGGRFIALDPADHSVDEIARSPPGLTRGSKPRPPVALALAAGPLGAQIAAFIMISDHDALSTIAVNGRLGPVRTPFTLAAAIKEPSAAAATVGGLVPGELATLTECEWLHASDSVLSR
jgi:hypothetical protein